MKNKLKIFDNLIKNKNQNFNKRIKKTIHIKVGVK